MESRGSGGIYVVCPTRTGRSPSPLNFAANARPPNIINHLRHGQRTGCGVTNVFKVRPYLHRTRAPYQLILAFWPGFASYMCTCTCTCT